MAAKNLNARVGMRTDTSSKWASVNPVLGKNEVVIESDTGLFKQGDGLLPYNDHPYLNTCNITTAVISGTKSINIPGNALVSQIKVVCIASQSDGSVTIRDIVTGESNDLIAYIQNIENGSEYLFDVDLVKGASHTISVVASEGVSARISIK